MPCDDCEAVSSHTNTEDQTVAPADWICQACSQQDFISVKFYWQAYCFFCGKERGRNLQQTSSSSNNTTEVRAVEEYIAEEEEQDSKLTIPQVVTPVTESERNYQICQ